MFILLAHINNFYVFFSQHILGSSVYIKKGLPYEFARAWLGEGLLTRCVKKSQFKHVMNTRMRYIYTHIFNEIKKSKIR